MATPDVGTGSNLRGGSERLRHRGEQGKGDQKQRSRSTAIRFQGLEPCAVCKFEGRGYGFQLDMNPAFARYEFCSMACQDVGAWIAKKQNPPGNIEGTKMLADLELRAITDAREQFFEALVRQKLDQHFENCTPEQIDDIIKSIVIGFQASVQRAYGRGEVPF